MVYVYAHFKKDINEPFYIGMGDTEKRPWNMRDRSEGHKDIVKNHGVRVEIIIDDLDWDTAGWWEIRWIKALKNSGYDLVNILPGGGTNPMFYPDVREKQLTNIKRGDDHYTKKIEARENLRIKNLGKKYSDETNKKKGKTGPKYFSEVAWENMRSPKKLETILKMKSAATARYAKAEEKEKMSHAKKGSEYCLKISWYNSCVMHQKYWGA